MSEYIIWESDKTETTDYLGVKHGVSHFEKCEEIVRCRDCKHFPGNCDWCYDDDPDGYCAWSCRRSDKE